MTNKDGRIRQPVATRSTRFRNRSYHIEKMAKDLADTRHELWVTMRPISTEYRCRHIWVAAAADRRPSLLSLPASSIHARVDLPTPMC